MIKMTAILMGLGLVACGGGDETTNTATTTTSTTETTTTTSTTGTTTTTNTSSTTGTTTTTTTPTTSTGGETYNPYTSYEGWETMDYEGYGYLFHMAWTISGTPIEMMSSDCENCLFMFDVSGDINEKETWGYSLSYANSGYGYSSDLGGNGESWVNNYYGNYYWWGYASIAEIPASGSTPCTTSTTTSTTTCTSTTTTGTEMAALQFNYWYGYIDYPYGGAYYTYWQYGDLVVE